MSFLMALTSPGGNVTGLTFFIAEISAKRLELLKEAVPRARRVAVLLNPDNAAMPPVLSAMELTATSLNVELQQVGVRAPEQFERAFSAMAAGHADGLVVIDDGMLIAHVRRIAELAAAKRLPGAGFSEYAATGGLMAYAVNFPAIWRRAAVYVDKILKGARPADLPIERPTRFEFVINLKTAKALGLTIPPAVLARADELIQ